jgi:hypothetical protein
MPEFMQTMKTGRGAVPVVENAKLPLMTERAPRPRAIEGKTLLMAAEPKPDTGKTGRMAAFAAVRPTRATVAKRPEMQGRKPVAEDTPKPDGYVRLRLRVEGEKVSVVGAKAVEGPLVERPQLEGQVAYEATLGTKRVAAGAVPDVGERRSFANPKGPKEQQGHYVSRVPTYEVMVRVPAAEVSLAALPRLEIKLYRIKETVTADRIQPGPLGPQFERELREIGRVKGITPEKLETPIGNELRKALG